MGLTSSKENTEITKVNFPLYDIKWFTHQHILLVGGGGSSKTGICNGIVSLFIINIIAIISHFISKYRSLYLRLNHNVLKYILLFHFTDQILFYTVY